MLAEVRRWNWPSVLIVLSILFLAGAATPLAIATSELRIGQLAAVGVIVAALATIWLPARLVFLFCYVLSISYNRQYYSLDWLYGGLGARGFYWCPSDIFLFLLLVKWAVDAARQSQSTPPGASTAIWILPLICVA